MQFLFRFVLYLLFAFGFSAPEKKTQLDYTKCFTLCRVHVVSAAAIMYFDINAYPILSK